MSDNARMLRTLRHMFVVGAAVGVLALVASACSLMGQRPAPEAPAAQAPPPAPSLTAIYRSERLRGEPIMRVRVADSVRTASVDGPTSVTLAPPGVEPELLVLRTPLAVSRSASGWVVEAEGETLRIPDPDRVSPTLADALVVRAVGEGLLTLDDAPLPGDLAFHAPQRTERFDVVEQVAIEAYLPGVVAKELYASWKLETFRAQAVAARSYALHERARRRSLGSHFDVVSTTQDQAYAGATTHPVAHKAVRDTAGVVLTWNGEILRSYYSSTVGGRAASAADTWPTQGPFAFNLAGPIQATDRGEEDELSPRNRWTVERSVGDVTSRLRAFGKSRGSDLARMSGLARIEAVNRNDYKRPTRYRLTDTSGGAYTLKAEDLRVALNTKAPGTPDIDAKTRVYSSDMMVRIEGDRVVIDGRGFGHGVGMSQFGAEALAREGWDAERILLYYYKGAELQRAY